MRGEQTADSEPKYEGDQLFVRPAPHVSHRMRQIAEFQDKNGSMLRGQPANPRANSAQLILSGMLANRDSTWPRDHFCRSTIAPRLSRPTTWKEFLPISMPITAIAVLRF